MHLFAAAFAEAWSAPTPERLCALPHPDVVLLQPHRPRSRGRDAALADFRRLLEWLRGPRGEVDRASGGPARVRIARSVRRFGGRLSRGGDEERHGDDEAHAQR